MKKRNDKKGKKLKIGFFCDAYEPITNGVTVAVNSLKKGLEAEGHKVIIVAPKYPGHHECRKDVVRIISLTLFSKSKYRFAVDAELKIKKVVSDVDIVHIHHPGPIGWIAANAARKQGKPYLFTHHTIYESYWHYLPLPKKSAKEFINYIIKVFCRKFRFIIVPSESVRKKLLSRHIKSKLHMAVIPTGIDLTGFSNPDGKSIRKRYGIGNDEIVLIFLSRIVKEKNIFLLMRSFKKIIDENKRKNNVGERRKIKLLIVGGGAELNNLMKFTSKLGLDDDVIFTNYIEHSEVPKHFAAADIFVFPSVSETQGLVSIEAMACGIPVVGMDAPGTRDVVVNSKTGFLCRNNVDDFANKTKELIYNDSLRRKLGKNGFVRAKKYTIEENIRDLIQFYEKVIDYYSGNKKARFHEKIKKLKYDFKFNRLVEKLELKWMR